MYKVYCLNYKNETRKNKMEKIFNQLGMDCFFYDGVDFSDERISKHNFIDHTKKVWSYTFGHFDMIHKFYYNSDYEFGIFCEDDILIHKDFKNNINNIINNFVELKLDVLLLGYLLPFKLDNSVNYYDFHKKETNDQMNNKYIYYDYNNNLWGAQMYMLSRKQAKYLLDKYGNDSGYADSTLNNPNLTPFSSDWTITKEGNKAIIYPMIALEDNTTNYQDDGQNYIHQGTYNNHINDEFIVF